MDLVATGPLRVALLRWLFSNGAPALTVVCKATFSLRPGESPLAAQQDGPNEDDTYWDDDSQRSLSASTDMVPYKARADVLLTGSAYSQVPVRSLVARLCVGSIDKSIEVHADRAIGPDGVLREGMPFTKMRLRYERAAGGAETNPVGMRFDVQDARGNVVLPNLSPVGASVTRRGEGFGPIGFGPVAPAWRERSGKVHRATPGWTPYGWTSRPLPEGFDASFFNAAPPDQQVESLRGDESIVLTHLHAEHARLTTKLADVAPRATVERPGAAPQPLALVCDTLSIDTDRGVCHLVFRGTVRLSHAAEAGRIVVSMGEEAPASGWDGAGSQVVDGERTMAPMMGGGGINAAMLLPFARGRSAPEPARPSQPSPSTALPFARSAQGSLSTTGMQQAVQVPPSATGAHAAVQVPPSSHSPMGIQKAPPSALATTGMHQAPPSLSTTGTHQAPPSLSTTGMHQAPVPPPRPSQQASYSPASSPHEGTAIVDFSAGQAQAGMPPPSSPRPMPPPAPVMAPLGPPGIQPPAMAPPAPVETSPWASQNAGAAPDSRGSFGERMLGEPPPSGPVDERRMRGEPEMVATMPRPAETALPSFLAAAAVSGVVAASNAAADPAPPAPARSARPASPRLVGSEAIDLVWFDPESVARIRRRPPWKVLLTDLENARDFDAEEAALGNTPEEIEDRRDVLHVLVHGAAVDDYGIQEALEHAVRADGKVIPPLVLTTGQLAFTFDEMEMLKATLACATPFAQGDEQLTSATASAKEFLSTPGLIATGAVIESLTIRIREAFGRIKRPVANDYLITQPERALLEKRHYQKREVFASTQLRGLFTPIGGSNPIPAYLPEEVSKKLPLYQRFAVRMVVEVHRTADQNELHHAALRAIALGRSLSARG